MSATSEDPTDPLRPHEIALLRGGPRAAVTVAVVGLHLRGAVEAGRPGTLRAREAAVADALPGHPPPSSLPPLESAVHASLHEPCGPRKLVRRPDVRLAVALMRIPLAQAGLLRHPLLGPTRAARRGVRALRERHALPAGRHGLTDDDKLLLVALHGEAALRALVPRFALRAGLLARAEVADKGFHGRPRGGGTGGTAHHHSCGGGGGTD
ncbi:TIGR04222 domain-containing membrane protein [Streptomyces sp. NPDC017936]|uniref:TIGR04222 domain-containing membrane protein n=1 Tax=Streptomyces sp. NPDC017936 TaxID=3365016 RepID=UPI0037A33C1F